MDSHIFSCVWGKRKIYFLSTFISVGFFFNRKFQLNVLRYYLMLLQGMCEGGKKLQYTDAGVRRRWIYKEKCGPVLDV